MTAVETLVNFLRAFERGEDNMAVIESPLPCPAFMLRAAKEAAEQLGCLTIAASVPLTIDGGVTKFVPAGVAAPEPKEEPVAVKPVETAATVKAAATVKPAETAATAATAATG